MGGSGAGIVVIAHVLPMLEHFSWQDQFRIFSLGYLVTLGTVVGAFKLKLPTQIKIEAKQRGVPAGSETSSIITIDAIKQKYPTYAEKLLPSLGGSISTVFDSK